MASIIEMSEIHLCETCEQCSDCGIFEEGVKIYDCQRYVPSFDWHTKGEEIT